MNQIRWSHDFYNTCWIPIIRHRQSFSVHKKRVHMTWSQWVTLKSFSETCFHYSYAKYVSLITICISCAMQISIAFREAVLLLQKAIVYKNFCFAGKNSFLEDLCFDIAFWEHSRKQHFENILESFYKFCRNMSLRNFPTALSSYPIISEPHFGSSNIESQGKVWPTHWVQAQLQRLLEWRNNPRVHIGSPYWMLCLVKEPSLSLG